jgi:hypothetical protein
MTRAGHNPVIINSCPVFVLVLYLFDIYSSYPIEVTVSSVIY